MFTFDQEDSPHTLKPTDFDIIRLESMDIGERLESESGNWVVLKYEKEYILSSHMIKKLVSFGKLNDLIKFLNK